MTETPSGRAWLTWLAAMIVVAVLAVAALAGRGHARDLGQWGDQDPALCA